MGRTLPMPPVVSLRGRSEARQIADDMQDLLSDILRADLQLAGMHRLYVTLTSELPDGVPIHPSVGGFYSPSLGTILESFVVDKLRRESGTGPVMVIRDRYGRCAAEWMRGAIVHEAAHALVADRMVAETVPVDAPPPASDGHSILATHPHNWPTSHAAHAGHPPQFLRACVHLQHRVALRGIDVPMPFINEWDSYGYRDSDAIIHALAGELDQAGPIRRILATPAPREFTRLCAADLK